MPCHYFKYTAALIVGHGVADTLAGSPFLSSCLVHETSELVDSQLPTADCDGRLKREEHRKVD